MVRKWMIAILCSLILLANSTMASAETEIVQVSNLKTLEEVCQHYDELVFEGNQSMDYATFQVELGYRIPGSEASAKLINSFSENATGYEVSTPSHFVDGMNATNLIAKYSPESSTGEVVIIAAHYDSRDRAERDENPDLRDNPIDGANDGASGVGVLFELLPIIPNMNLSHDVWLILFDAEDQGVTPSMLGSKAWAANLTQEEIDTISAFILLDMVGDIDFNFRKEMLSTPILWDTMLNITTALGFVDGELDCLGEQGTDVYNLNKVPVWIQDDHVSATNVGIPAIDIIDVNYGDETILGGYFHTTNDTLDKISAESLGKAGKIVELGLRSGSWIDYQPSFIEIVNSTTNNTEEEIIESRMFSAFEKIVITSQIILIIGIVVSIRIIKSIELASRPRTK